MSLFRRNPEVKDAVDFFSGMEIVPPPFEVGKPIRVYYQDEAGYHAQEVKIYSVERETTSKGTEHKAYGFNEDRTVWVSVHVKEGAR